MENEMRRLITVLLVTTLITVTAYAQDDADNERQKGRRGPPEAALEACASSVQGDPCSFEGRRDEMVEGTCEAPDDKPLACRPDGGKRNEFRDAE
jgi:hypothetical protein